ncbi:unnamed protein product, partial [marine sediment metagenome]
MTDHLEIAKHRVPSGNPVQEHYTVGQFQARRWIRTAWADRYAKIDELGAMNWGAGELWPYRPDRGAYLSAVQIVGHGRAQFDASGLVSYDAAMIELNYSTMAPMLFGSSYVVSETIEPFKQHLSFPASGYGLRWGAEDGDLISGWLSH